MNYENMELWQAMKASKYRDTLKDLELSVKGAENLDDILRSMLNAIVDAIHAEAGTLWFYDFFASGTIIPKAVYGGGEIGNISLRPGEGIAGGVIKDGKPVMIADCQKDPRWAGKVDSKTGFQTKSMICVPLEASESKMAFGSVQIINKADGSLFDEEDFRFACELAKEFSKVYLSRATEKIVGISPVRKAYGFDTALECKTEEEMQKCLEKSLKEAGTDEQAIPKIVKLAGKVYRLLGK